MHAVIKTGGKQYRVQPGDEFNIEKLSEVEDGGEVTFDRVLAVGEGEDIEIGKPFVEGASVKADVLVAEGKGRKKIVFKKKRRKGYRRKRGHRQPFTRVRITEVDAG
jgi:large subunit ribosomal protein L21